jgi:hypothetical protein
VRKVFERLAEKAFVDRFNANCMVFKAHRLLQRFRGGLVLEAQRLLYDSTLGLRVTKVTPVILHGVDIQHPKRDRGARGGDSCGRSSSGWPRRRLSTASTPTAWSKPKP